jgi:Ca-activated chloride channel family protein
MTLTTLTVWSVTPTGGWSEVAERAQSLGLEDVAAQAVVAKADTWKFVDGSTLLVEGRLGHATLNNAQDNETFMYLNVKAPADKAATQAAPVDLAIVIDRSGSMRGKRIRNAIDAARGMVGRLRDGDRVSVVTYNTTAQTLVPPTTLSSASRQNIISQLGGITAAGDTCISCAIDAGMTLLRSSSQSFGQVDNRVKRMLLLSDGQATAGVRDVNGFTQLAARARDMGCSISSVGVDVDYNQRIMSTIAAQSNGRHYFVENATSLGTIFDQELSSLVRTVATNAEMRVALAPGVQVLEVFDRAFRREGNTLVVPMGMFTASDEKTVLVKVRVPRGAEGDRPIADVSLQFQDLVAGNTGNCNGKLEASLSSDPSKASKLDPLVGARIGRAETAALLRNANTLFETGDQRQALAAIANKRSELRRRRATLSTRTAAKRKKDVNDDFDGQLAALDKAESGFATPPAAAQPGAAPAPPPQQTRAGRAQVRANEESAADLAF